MSTFGEPVLGFEDFFINLACSMPTGIVGQVWHKYPAPSGVRTPVGYLLGFLREASEIEPEQWNIQLFFRGDIHYDERRKMVSVDQNGSAPPPHYHPDLPKAIGNMLLDRCACFEPMGLTTNVYKSRTFVEYGSTWLDD